MTDDQPHPNSCGTCEHHKLVGRIPDIDECDILKHIPTKSDIELIKEIGCASYRNWKELDDNDYLLNLLVVKLSQKIIYYKNGKIKSKPGLTRDELYDCFEQYQNTRSLQSPFSTAAIRKDERERVLDEKNIKIIRKGCIHPYWEKCGGLNKCEYFNENTGDCLFDVDIFIESLRAGDE